MCTFKRPIHASVLLACAVLAGCEDPAPCPEVMDRARHLILVTTETMDGPAARLQTFERAGAGQSWTSVSPSEPAVVGANGVAWGYSFRHLAKASEPLKVEGDKRAPAGIFPVGPTFGFTDAPFAGHLKLAKDQHICVDDPASAYYSRIVSRSLAGAATRGEEMAEVPVYDKGIVIDYPTNRAAKAGSCIFLHIWEAEAKGTAGCVALAAPSVERLQAFAASAPTVIAIVPAHASDRLRRCLP